MFFGLKKRNNKFVKGILFHTITTKTEPHCSFYSPIKFESLLSRLSGEGFTFATVSGVANTIFSSQKKSRLLTITFDDGFESFYTQALPILERHGILVTVFSVAGFLGKASTWDALPQQKHLSTSQLKEVSRLGHEIGSHTVSHANLTLLSGIDLKNELCDSKKMIEDCICKDVTSISFPFGRVNKRVWAAACEAGYKSATTYAYHCPADPRIIPLQGVYSYDSVQDVVDRTVRQPLISNAIARGCVMPHFAKGSPLWKFRKNYAIIR